MSDYARQQAEKDVRDGKNAADMQNAHWKQRQDYEAAYAREKEKQNK